MNALFVDDELDVLDGILNEIEFEKIGISNVYTASTAMRAKEILSETPIDILVTDIEMPQMSGLELLEWAQKNKLSMVSIFCTAYSDFNYAQKAIKLHAFDYFLKPIFFSALQDKLEAAVNEAKRIHEQEQNERKGYYWESIQGQIRNTFWEKLIERPSEPHSESIARLLEEFKLNYSLTEGFQMIALDLSETAWSETTQCVRTFLAAEKILSEALYQPENVVLYLVVRRELLSDEQMKPFCSRLLKKVTEGSRSKISLYYLKNVPYPDAYRAFQKLRDVMSVELASNGCCYDVEHYTQGQTSYQNENLLRWEEMMYTQQAEKVIQEAEAFLDALETSHQLNRQSLVSFRIDLLQLTYAVLRRNELVPRELFLDPVYAFRYEEAVQSVGKMKKFLRYLLSTIKMKIEEMRQADTMIGTVLQYIHTHLNERITRETLASLVYLNPDYFARVFRQTQNMSLGSYLKKCRIEEAKRLLASSNMTVGMISYEVGFENFSYFSQMFRKVAGCSPKEYRMKNRNSEDDETDPRNV